jgi:rod shape-determining protein MreC
VRKRFWLTFGLLGILGMGIGVHHNHRIQRQQSDPVVGIVRSVVVPIQSGVSSTTDSVSDFFTSIFRARQVTGRYEALVAENQKLKNELSQVEVLRRENEQLARLLALREQTQGDWVACRITANYPQIGDQVLILDKGTLHGVQPGSPVVSSEGLVGVIVDAGKNYAHARLITASRIAVSARVQNQAKTSVGICEGQDEFLLRLNFLPLNAKVQAGDKVVTAGLGGKYPAGIPIGIVEKVWEDRRYSIKQAHVRPFVALDELSFVLVRKAVPVQREH